MVQRQAVRRMRMRRHDGVARGCVALACALSVACGVCASARAQQPNCLDERTAVHDATAHGKWLTRWNQGNIGWHLDTVHPQLLKHAEVLLPAGDGDGGFGHRVWVPLCGKSVDVTWLAVSGHRVLGVELSGMAIDQLFEQFRLPRTTWQPPAPRGIHRVHTCGNIGVVEGNVFALPSANVTAMRQPWLSTREETLAMLHGKLLVDAVWDRGAMVAIEPAHRGEYAALQSSMVRTGGRILMLAVQYDESLATGPPHSIRHDELKTLYEPHGFDVRMLDIQEAIDMAPPRMREKGMASMKEVTYLLTKR